MDYKVKDIGLAEQGRREIEIAEKDMPGLMILREKFGKQSPQGCKNHGLFAHDRSNGSAH